MEQGTVKQRLTDFLKVKGVSKSEFGRRIGVSSAFVTSIRVSIQPDKLESIALEFPDLNTDWLMTGKGPMLRPVVDSSVIVNGNGNFGNGNGNTIQQVGTTTSSNEAVLAERVKSLEALVNEKERLIKVLMERK